MRAVVILCLLLVGCAAPRPAVEHRAVYGAAGFRCAVCGQKLTNPAWVVRVEGRPVLYAHEGCYGPEE